VCSQWCSKKHPVQRNDLLLLKPRNVHVMPFSGWIWSRREWKQVGNILREFRSSITPPMCSGSKHKGRINGSQQWFVKKILVPNLNYAGLA
jgi:hypothetical protein